MKSGREWLRGVVTGCRLLRSPRELPAMVVALATGVGLTVAAYSLIHAVLIRPLPYREPERLVQIWDFDPERPDLRVLRDRQTSFWVPVLVVPPGMLAPRDRLGRGVSRLGTGISVTASRTIARLRAGVTPAAAQAQLNVRLSRPGDPTGRVRNRVESHESLLAAPVRPALIVLQAGSGLVLLLVCLNVGWLFAARGRRLRGVFATLRALGATTGQVLVTHLASAACMAAVAAPC